MSGDNKSSTLGMARPVGARGVKATHILDVLKQGIHTGDYAPGTRLPTEFELTRRFSVSRPTAAKALNELERLGLVQRIPGSGSYVKRSPHGVPSLRGKTLGLLIPGLGTTEIFEPICGSLAACAESSGCTLVWGSCHDGTSAEQLALRYVQQHVDGVFFAPVELMAAFEQAGLSLPKEMKVAGFDDVSYARHVKIPLTTIRQPCAAIGMAAFDAMTSRLASPALPPRTIRLESELIIRTSTQF